MSRTLNIIFALIITFSFSCSGKKNGEKPKNIEKVSSVEVLEENQINTNELDKSEKVLFERVSDNEIWIYNCLYSGFTGETTLIKVNENLKIKSAFYNYWTDVIDENSTEFKVANSKIEFSKNPFKTNDQININYELKINEISNQTKKIVNSKIITFKIKSKEMAENEENKYKKKYDFINSFNAYKIKYTDKKPELLLNIKSFKIELNSVFKINKISILFSIDTKGKVLKESIKLRTSEKLTTEQKEKITELIIEKLNYSPGYINETPVRTELYLRI
ncbi:hypothetical protein JL193_15905 [Polaribacter batillariae]|uniref:TonB C-terminal domain-containing protein n=1 Tax=Polaribacter batillariae TaxID=2808900 RepID=A0ABX7STG1_9FLAO|nr:hypothetical protein [Polaribacter batillariae]QTD37540.1 hypothetical protein JL193_15905 [Polaribacter batillariae]